MGIVAPTRGDIRQGFVCERSLSPHRVLAVDQNDELIDPSKSTAGDEQDFVQMILENLKTAGVQQAHKEDKM